MRTLAMMVLALLLVTIMLLLSSSPSAGQSVDVQVYGDTSAIRFDGPTEGEVGDTLVMGFALINPDGSPSAGLAQWSISGNATMLEVNYASVAFRLDSVGTATISVDVRRVGRTQMGALWLAGPRRGEFTWDVEHLVVTDDLVGQEVLELCYIFWSPGPVEEVIGATTTRCALESWDLGSRSGRRAPVDVVPMEAYRKAATPGM